MAIPTDLLNGVPFDLDDIQVRGVSLSGVRTSFAVPVLDCAFDVAQGLPFQFNLNQFFISHVHMDHASGIPYLISQKTMYHHKPPVFYVPASAVEGLREIMRVWEKLEEHTYKYEFIPVSDGFEKMLKPGFLLRAFRTVHRVESFGYTIFRINKKLKPEYQGLPQEKLQELRRAGNTLQHVIEEPFFTFTGDTQIEFLDAKPWIRQSKYLFMECTYLDGAKTVAHAREWGHTHLDEILPQIPSFEGEKMVLIHISSRYRTEQAEEIVRQRVPGPLQSKVTIFPGR